MHVFCGGGVRFCHSSFCGVRFEGPSQATEALQPTRTHNYTHICRHTHLTDRQIDRQWVGHLCSLSPFICSVLSFFLSFTVFWRSVHVPAACLHHYQRRRHSVPIVFADGEVPRALFSAGGWPAFTHSKVQKPCAPSYFLAKWILNANWKAKTLFNN